MQNFVRNLRRGIDNAKGGGREGGRSLTAFWRGSCLTMNKSSLLLALMIVRETPLVTNSFFYGVANWDKVFDDSS